MPAGARGRKNRPNLTFYPAEIDAMPAAFVVDLEQEPRKSHATRIVVSIVMREPTEDGLRSEQEMAALDGVHERVATRLAAKFDAEHVGFYDTQGAATLVFYAAKKATAQSVKDALGDLGGYATQVYVAQDASWEFYIDVLFPDAYAFQGIYNRAAIDELEDLGDALEEPRDVEHLVTFPTKAAVSRARTALEAAHFKIDGVEPTDEGGRVALVFHRAETLEGNKPNRLATEILDLVLPLGGEYEGWGAEPVLPTAPPKRSAPKAKTKKASKTPPKKASPKKKSTTKKKSRR